MFANPRGGRSYLAVVVLAAGLVRCGDDARRPAEETGVDEVIPFPACERVGIDPGTVGMIEADAFEVSPAFGLTGETIVVHRRGSQANNATWDLELVAYDPNTMEVRQVTANDTDDFLLDTHGAAVLYATTTDAGGRELILERGDERQVLDGSALAAPFWDEVRPIRLLSDEAAAWLAYDETQLPGRYHPAVKLHVDGQTFELSTDLVGSQVPDLLGRSVVWAGYDESTSWNIYVATVLEGRVQRQQITSGEGLDRDPMLGDDAVYWLSDGAARRWDRETGLTETLHEGPCMDLAVDGERAAFVCAVDPETLNLWPRQGNQVWYWDGQQLRLVHETDETILEVALAADRGTAALAWAAYPDLSVVYNAVGTLYFMTPDGADREAMSLAEIGSGCWFCDMLWPPVALRLNGSFIAWNYAVTEPTQPPHTPDAIGYARLGSNVRCAADGL